MPNDQEIQEHSANFLEMAKIRKQSTESGKGSLEIEALYAMEASWFVRNKVDFPKEVVPYLFTVIPMEEQ